MQRERYKKGTSMAISYGGFERVGKIFAKYGMLGWWKPEYEKMEGEEIRADLVARKAPVSNLFLALRKIKKVK